MNTKRNLPECDEIVAKKPKLTDGLASDDVSVAEKTLVASECQTTSEAQSHGEPTFGAIIDSNGDADSELNDLGIDCFDESDSSDDQNRQPVAGPMGFIQRHIELGTDPRHILQEMLPSNMALPEDMDMFMMWKLIFDLLTDPQPRNKLLDVNTLDQVMNLMKTCKNILVLTGAGVSVSCGIPDFRSRDGIYARLSKEYPDLPDPQAMFDIKYFRYNSKPFYKFAKEIYPGKFQPSLSHRFIQKLQKSGQLLRNYTQNIDTLEREAGIARVIECHGSFSTASCTNCKYKVTSDVIRDDILNQVTPLCPRCPVSEETLSVMKPDIVFFGESLPQKFYDCIEQDIKQVDLLIVIGSSLKVRPVNLIPNQIPANVPQVLINREPLPHMNFDVELLGDCDMILGYMCQQLGETWCDVLQGFDILNVSKEFLMPFLQTPPACPKEGYECDGLRDEDNVLQNKLSNQEEETADNINSCLINSNETEDKGIPYIFLPPCRYIFHGAEVGQCDSLPTLDKNEESSETDSSSECSDVTGEDWISTDHGQLEQDKNLTDYLGQRQKPGVEQNDFQKT